MKSVTYIILEIWSAITGFLSPVWLTLTALNLTGLIYQYDYSMDEGTALILGFTPNHRHICMEHITGKAWFFKSE